MQNIPLKIALIAPSSTFKQEDLEHAVLKAQNHGIKILSNTQANTGTPGFLNGSKNQRLLELAQAEKSDCDVLWAIRGGCGALELWHDYDAKYYANQRAYLIGYSDTTILHFMRYYNAKRLGIHGPNFLNFDEQLDSIKLLLDHKQENISYPPLRKINYFLHKNIKGELIIMNLFSLQSLIGCFDPSFFRGKILAIEETNEPLYKIYRALWQLKNAGALIGLRALLIGHMPPSRDQIINEVFLPIAKDLAIPLFDWPIFGHEKPNWPLLFGARVIICQVDETLFTLSYAHENLDARYV